MKDRSEAGVLTGAIARAWLVVLISAFITACIYFVVSTNSYSLKWSDAPDIFIVSVASAGITVPFSFAAAIVLGFPILRWLYRHGQTSVFAYLIGGGLMSAGCVLPIALSHAHGKFPVADSDYSLALWITVVSGPVAALTARRLLVPIIAWSSNQRVWTPPSSGK